MGNSIRMGTCGYEPRLSERLPWIQDHFGMIMLIPTRGEPQPHRYVNEKEESSESEKESQKESEHDKNSEKTNKEGPEPSTMGWLFNLVGGKEKDDEKKETARSDQRQTTTEGAGVNEGPYQRF